ncbi:Ku protein [Tumebacillus permanentifrigoris]|uniref:Non-homologous end joining protein Ku n=1 Tax=Tumebacillus permanentifrigoris TaxID=378543 RepID=A0A316DCW2_9BACL|nr:Ku protein [Tumebacillus permanentifrigoris]PWK15568.1 Ku protein [Tumebacillus permanentifrigoris]
MHTMWKGSISFGLVNIPVKMFAATEDKDIKFRMLHEKCGTPVKQVRTCPHCEEEVEWKAVVKGFEYQSGQFVIMSEEDMEKISPQRTKTIDILNFVSLEEIDPIYFNKSYFLAPEESGGKAYSLLRQAMKDSGRIALVKVIIRSAQMLAVLRVYDNVLVMESIYYPEEVRSVTQLPSVPAEGAVDENEMRVAQQLIDSLATTFDPEQYRDEYRAALLAAIDQKVEGQEITTVQEPRRDQIQDLMAALQASLNVERPTTSAQEAERMVVGGNDTGPVDAVAKPKEAEGGGSVLKAVMGSTSGEGTAEKPKRRRRKATTEE